eukprot:TRINITY_DN751_c0_g2_i6.p1 TRINITY_DN751_c0_g2~~TRINITY_DN751_c0_g2_i6.p1  ORF type:complete len:158 (-),score=24.60 TRINITY_DN751_c0_g2_i6:25-498(-)
MCIRDRPLLYSKPTAYTFSFGTIPPPATYSTTIPPADTSFQLLKEINNDLAFLESHLDHAFPSIPPKSLPKFYQESAVEIGTQVEPVLKPAPIKIAPIEKIPSATVPSPLDTYGQANRSVAKGYRPLTYSPYYNGRVKEEPFRCMKEFYRVIRTQKE